MIKFGVVGIAVDEGSAVVVVRGSALVSLVLVTAGFGLRFSAKGFLATPVMAFAILVTSVDSFFFGGGLPTSAALRLFAIVRIDGLGGGKRLAEWKMTCWVEFL